MADQELDNPEPRPTEVDQTLPLPRSDSSRGKVENTYQRLANAETQDDLRQQPVEQTLQLSGEALSKLLTGSGPAPSKASATAPKGELPASGTRFHILRPWREGGLGKVSIARDEELHREVALKEIKPQHASSKNNQARFLIEGEITGSLEHPGIVPVYGMGRYADGRPYYAMRFVHGESFEEAIAHFHKADEQAKSKFGERTVAFRELINRFIAVCNAMAYAHSRGVIHRDLKPSNILLAKYGETLVVDWGLAKVAGRADDLAVAPNESMLNLQSGTASTATRLGSVIGTPAYMSPEQAEGRQDLMGPATDIYSLGATLYCLLTGASPFTAHQLSEVLDKVKRGDFKSPRELQPKLPRPLDAICLKAMALKREDRYKSAGDLASDLQHWLGDEPVTAHPEGPRERAVRWLRRHRSLALAIALALAVVTGVSIVATALINHQRVIANEARENADVAFHEARDAVDELFTEVSENSLLNQPGMTALRTELLRRTLNYYERFLQQRADDPTVKQEIGMTLFRVGRIIDELQSPESAVPKFQQAVKMQKELLAEKPNDVNRLHALGDSYNALGRSLHRGLHYDDAFNAYDEGRKLRQQLADLSPQNVDHRRSLANSLMNLGLVERDRGKLEAAAEKLQAAQTIRTTLAAAGNKDPKLHRDIAMGAFNLGNLAVVQRHLDEAAKHYNAAIAEFKSLHEQQPRDLRIQSLLATSYRSAGDVLADSAPEESSQMFELARQSFARLADQDPEVSSYQQDLANLYANLGDRQEGTTAIASFEQAESILNKLVQKFPTNRVFRSNLAATWRGLGRKQIAAGQREAGLKNLRRSVDELETLVKEVPQDELLQSELKTSREALEDAIAAPAQTETV